MSAAGNALLISKGAEAKIYEINFLNHPAILKQRFRKEYRLAELDAKITVKRILQEIRAMQRCTKAGVITPIVYHANPDKSLIIMERIVGATLKEFLLKYGSSEIAEQKELVKVPNDDISSFGALAKNTNDDISLRLRWSLIVLITRDAMFQVGLTLAKMHEVGCIHGDLTTSNIMLKSPNLTEGSELPRFESIVLIDFGLSSISAQLEDKAVDLYVLERAFQATHPRLSSLFHDVLAAYSSYDKKKDLVIKKLEEGLEEEKEAWWAK